MNVKEFMYRFAYDGSAKEILLIRNEDNDNKLVEITAEHHLYLNDKILDKKVEHWRMDGIVITLWIKTEE